MSEKPSKFIDRDFFVPVLQSSPKHKFGSTARKSVSPLRLTKHKQKKTASVLPAKLIESNSKMNE